MGNTIRLRRPVSGQTQGWAIRKNPFDFMLVSVVIDDSITREALSREDERKLLRFIQEDPHFSKYYEGIYTFCLKAE